MLITCLHSLSGFTPGQFQSNAVSETVKKNHSFPCVLIFLSLIIKSVQQKYSVLKQWQLFLRKV